MPRTRTSSRSEPETRADARDEDTRAESGRGEPSRSERAPSTRRAGAREGAAKEGASRESARRAAARWRHARQLALMIGILGCVFAVVALASYAPTDPSFSRRGGGEVQNLAGPAGAWLADVALQVVGYGAWAVLVLGVQLGRKLAGRTIGGLAAATGWSVATWAALSIVALVLGAPAEAPFPPGGLVGQVSAESLNAVFGPVGAWIVVLGALLLAAPFAFGVDWERVAASTLGGIEGALPQVGRAGVVGVRSAIGGVASAGAALGSRLRRSEPELDELSDAMDEGSEGWDEGDEDDLEVELDPPRPALAAKPAPARGPEPRPGWPALRAPAPVVRPLPPVERPSISAPTQAAAHELVEVEWDPTAVPAPREVEPTRPHAGRRAPVQADPPSVAERLSGPLRLADDEAPARPGRGVPHALQDDGPSVGPLEVPSPAHVAPRPAPPRPEPAKAPAPARPRGALAGSVANPLRVIPGALESGGGDDDGLALIARQHAAAYEPPHLGLLDVHERDVAQVDELELHELARTLEAKLSDFGVNGEVTAIRPGPVITTFEYQPAPGIKLSRISSLSDDIAMALKALRVRIVAPIPGKGVVGIEIPNKHRQTVWLRDLFACEAFRKSKANLPITLGKSVEGQPRIADLASMPHLLVGGTTGSGKSVGVNAMLLSMLFTRTPEELKLILIDPKMLEFELYRDIPHLLHPVVTDPRLASAALKWACTEMDARYALLSRWQTRNIEGYNRKVDEEMADWTPAKARRYAPPDWPEGEPPPPPKKLPYIVIVIDELADLMMVSAKDVEESIIRIAQKARAAGIHLIVATQRPSVNVITGLIKANMPSRIAFQVRTKVDGRTILDQNGAENLLGKGDMLFLPPGVSALERLHGPFVADDEVRRVNDFLRAQGPPNYEAEIRLDEEDGENAISPDEYDELYDAAVRYVAREGKASASMIQREFKIGYNRAARMIEIMEKEGVVGQADGARPREVLVNRSTA